MRLIVVVQTLSRESHRTFCNPVEENLAMHYTCNSCKLEFPDLLGQKEHMRSEWHRYNLKRRVAQLPPVDETTFNTKVSVHTEVDSSNGSPTDRQSKKELRKQAKEAILEQKRQILEIARKSMLENSSPDQLQKDTELYDKCNSVNNNTSKGEVVDESALEEELISEKLKNKVDISPTTCLFCQRKYNSNFASVEDNLEHMRSKHGLFIPERNFLTDAEGLLRYLGEKIGFGNVCLCCLYQGKDIVAVRDHMLNKRHMMIPYDTEDNKLEISDFYDFSSTYAQSVHEGQEEDWEDTDEEADENDDDDDLLYSSSDVIYKDGLDLVLPSGTVLGHRAMNRYYRQNLPPERILSEGQGTVIAAESRHMLGFKDRKELSTQKRAWAREKKRDDVNDRRAAKFINNQPHFRDQLLQ